MLIQQLFFGFNEVKTHCQLKLLKIMNTNSWKS
jgi:hypothetical protein